ncbi:hypothetical protein ABZ935_25250 [Streptomyces coeruleorubidus]
MIGNRITYRTADGVRVPGTWRHAFIRNGAYFLTDLFIYADGLIDCWGLVTLEEFAEKLRRGWVATELPDGARVSAHDLAAWRFSEPRTWLTPELLLAEVRDTIDQLNGRPDSTARCLAAVDAFLADRTEENRTAARAAYLGIPETQRHYALGDMDRAPGPGDRTRRAPGRRPGRTGHAGGVRRRDRLLRGAGEVDRGTARPSPGRRARDTVRPRHPPVPEPFPQGPGRPWHDCTAQ